MLAHSEPGWSPSVLAYLAKVSSRDWLFPRRTIYHPALPALSLSSHFDFVSLRLPFSLSSGTGSGPTRAPSRGRVVGEGTGTWVTQLEATGRPRHDARKQRLERRQENHRQV